VITHNNGPPASSRHAVLQQAPAVAIETKIAGWKPAVRYCAIVVVSVCAAIGAADQSFSVRTSPRAVHARRVKKYDSLTGLWTGAYTYPWAEAAVPFNARLEETGESLTGEIDEPNTFADPSAARLFASVRGARQGMNVSFIKRYDGSAGQKHTIGYEGQVNADFTRIDGRWSLPDTSGSFFMERADAGAEAAVSRAASATA
jgi:hypothetical protein